MKPESERLCPLLKKPCIQEDCLWWIKLRGKDPQGGEIDHYDCSIRWLPILQIENSGEAMKIQGEIEAMRKESMVHGQALKMLAEAMSSIRDMAEIEHDRQVKLIESKEEIPSG